MSRKIKEEELDKLLEEELIREADMIEKSLLTDGDEEFSVSKEDISRSYSRLLKRAKAEGILTEETGSQTAEIVKFPGNRGKSETSVDENALETEKLECETEDEMMFDEIMQSFGYFESEKKRSWSFLGKAAGFILLFALSILAGSMAGKASRKNFVSTIEYVMSSETGMVFVK